MDIVNYLTTLVYKITNNEFAKLKDIKKNKLVQIELDATENE